MSNEYGISVGDEKDIRERDKTCVYCRKVMIDHSENGRRSDWSTIEHFNSLPPWNDPSTVAICCWSCNSSRGDKKLLDWFKTPYCFKRNINEKTVAEPVVKYICERENRLVRPDNSPSFPTPRKSQIDWYPLNQTSYCNS